MITPVATMTNPPSLGSQRAEGVTFSSRMNTATAAIQLRCIRPIMNRTSIRPQQQPKQ
jgi:hypothetical protein